MATTRISRRDFLKWTGAAAAMPMVGRAFQKLGRTGLEGPDFPEPGTIGLGRAAAWGISIYDKPKRTAVEIDILKTDAVIPLYGEVEGDIFFGVNKRWYETDMGYVYGSFIQPVENSPQKPVASVPETGWLAEVSVPYVDARHAPDATSGVDYRLYYSTVYRVLTRETDATGQIWYGMADGGGFDIARYVPAEAMRIVRPEDLTPLSVGADKYIKVSIKNQLLEAFEGTRKVFEARVASGAVFRVDGELQDFTTPIGMHSVIRKRPASHMTGGTKGKSDYYDLPGVPFCSYITASAVAIHGAYWHNDFGRPRSHGCLNVLASHARWVYRWVEPQIAYDQERVETWEGGTPVEVVSS